MGADDFRVGQVETIIEARQHWDRLFKRYAWKRGLSDDIGRAAEHLGRHMSAEAFDRFAALKEVGRAVAQDDEDSGSGF